MDYVGQAVALIIEGDSGLLEILAVTLQMGFASTVISCLIGLPLGALAGSRNFRGRWLFHRLTGTMMSLPPVVAGLFVFLLLSRSGPLGSLRLLYTVRAMVIAQVVLITPVMTGMSAAVVAARAPGLLESCRGMGFSEARCTLFLILECRAQLLSVVLAGFGRSLAEVGAVQLVGGNVLGKTRVMTTAIMLETNMGRFGFALALGFILLSISFAVHVLVFLLEEGTHDKI